jgi:hypothetical protein
MTDISIETLQILQQVRQVYVDTFSEVLNSFGDKTVLNEAILLDSDGKPALIGGSGTPNRVDVSVVGEGLGMIASQNQVSFPPYTIKFGDMDVNLSPFLWDNAVFEINAKFENAENDLLAAWFERSFNPTLVSGSGELLEVIHYMSAPSQNGLFTVIEIDFGSADVGTFVELLKVLNSIGATEISVSSKSDEQ